MAGLTAEGLVIKRYADILSEKRERAVSRFLDLVAPGDNLDLSDSSTIGRLIALSIPGEADLWEAVQEVYDGFNPNAAEGISLDNLVALGGINRFGQTHSTVQLIFTGNTSTVIPSGSTVTSPTTGEAWEVLGGSIFLDPSRANGVGIEITTVSPMTDYRIEFVTDSTTNTVVYRSSASPSKDEVLFGLLQQAQVNNPTIFADVSDGTLFLRSNIVFQEGEWEVSSNMGVTRVEKVGTAMSARPGPVEAFPNTITNIRTPVLGWSSVFNPASATLGRWMESDEELRLRFRNSKYQRAGNIIEALYTTLLNIPEVREVKIYENDTDNTDENGIPAHSFMPVVLGGDGQGVAESIWHNKPLGIRSYGNTVVTIIDSQFFPHDIGFERPAPVPVYITLDISTSEEFPADGIQKIRESLVSYFDTFKIGDDVTYSRLYTPINKVQGHQVDSLRIGTTPDPTSSSNIVVPFNQIASITPANITVNIE